MLTSLQNPLVKQLRKLHRSKERRSHQLCLLEGTHLLEAACAVGYPLQVVCHTPDWQHRHPQLWQQAIAQAQRVEVVSPEVLKSMATTVQPDGVIAVSGRSRGQQLQPCHPVSLGLALETIQDPGNLGTIIRTAAAAGVDGLWLSADSVDLDHPKVLRASAGQWFQLKMAVSADLKANVKQAQAAGVQVVATCPDADRVHWHADLRRPTLLLLGNEGAGLSPELIALANLQVKIPLQVGVESLNVAIATAILLYEAQRQRDVNALPH
ncbi:MAG: RNA methyltransferase [Cyanothece sp. SIO1E1]|nr:RNA methyltransferase [Cyanothece sp. SIO1E1]